MTVAHSCALLSPTTVGELEGAIAGASRDDAIRPLSSVLPHFVSELTKQRL